ncbi:DNA/RNA non-specific endonuclease [Luteimonas sp. SX5]|uniref:DNA/RNA non-specific endonuclease n=1 Tax=Luteimonas galliterrae TaxID=2940486 RepID=A0ABT0MKU8_9GAMM|nr:DNA/RNA non-specific endonuclease [Luteimonas galliterrae]MCL1635516.1 DNA/RNA non-specific endonuclease [Luteimonas galliterrae]
MLDPVRTSEPQSAAAQASQGTPSDAENLQLALRDAPLTERPHTALAATQRMDDGELLALAGSEQGTQALAALDNALADAPPTLDGVREQRLRLGDALDRSPHPVDANPVGSPSTSAFPAIVPFGALAQIFPAASATTQTTARIGDNTVTWTNDSQGRPIRAEADLTEVFEGIDRSSAETDAQREAADRGIEGDQGGHLIGHRFVKDQGLKNLFPQNGNFNVSAYKTLENEWADWIDSGKDVHIVVQLTPKDQDRPNHVRVSYEVTDPVSGDVVYDQRVTFRNEAGQRYDRIPRADMDNY